MSNSIILKSYLDIRNEYPAAVDTIKPGALFAVTSAGKVGLATAAQSVEKLFAIEDELQGAIKDTAFSSDAPIQAWTATPGDEAQAWLAAGQDVAQGALLQGAANGQLTAVTSGTPVAVALEDVDLSASGAAAGLIKVRIL